MFQALSFIGAQVFTLEQSQVFAVSRICHNMRKSGYRDQEITLVLKALYITTTRQDVREAWWVINRRHLAEIPRPDFLSTLLDIFGPEARAAIVNILDRQARRPRMALGGDGRIVLGGGGAGGSADGSADQMIGFQEFAAMMPQLAKDVATERVADFVAREAKELAESAATGMHSMLTELQVIEPSLTSKIPPAALPRAGAITERMLAAGYTQRQANNAISALFVSRDQRALVRLWGSFDRARAGPAARPNVGEAATSLALAAPSVRASGCNISTETFDRAMLMFSDCLLPEQLPELRAQLGFVQPGQVTLREFEAALRLLVPKDGSPPDLRKIQSKVMLADLLGGPGNVDRLQSFQRQRVARLAQRMHNFGYDPPAMVMVCRTLFLTKLHNKDLWTMWRFFSRGRTETPLTLTQTRRPDG